MWIASRIGAKFGDKWDCVSVAAAGILRLSRRGKRTRITWFRSGDPGPGSMASVIGHGRQRWLRPPRLNGLVPSGHFCVLGFHSPSRGGSTDEAGAENVRARDARGCCHRWAAGRRLNRGPAQRDAALDSKRPAREAPDRPSIKRPSPLRHDDVPVRRLIGRVVHRIGVGVELRAMHGLHARVAIRVQRAERPGLLRGVEARQPWAAR